MSKGLKLAVLVIVMAVSAGRSSGQMQPQVDSAMARLEKVSLFAMRPVGFAGVTSQGQQDFRVIMQQPGPEALVLLETLYAHGKGAGKAYALVGIHTLDPARFEVLAAEVSGSEETVGLQLGCIMFGSKLKDVVRQIGAGQY